MDKPLQRVSLAIVHRDGRWLVARRRQAAHLGGLWEFPGGKLQPRETARAAALRELHEECGVHATAERTLDLQRCEYEDRVVELTPVVCQWVAGEAVPLGNEECRWVSPAELERLDMPAINSTIRRALFA